MATLTLQPEKGASLHHNQHSNPWTESESSSSTHQQGAPQPQSQNEPPPYSGPASPSPGPSNQQLPSNTYPSNNHGTLGIPVLDYRLYNPPTFSLSENQTTITSHDKQLNTQKSALLGMLQKLANVPPKPEVRIVGKSGPSDGVDFDIRLNCMGLFVGPGKESGGGSGGNERGGEGGMNYLYTLPPGEVGWRGGSKKGLEPGLEGVESWVERFCGDERLEKEFIMERCVINWDTTYLTTTLYLLFHSIGYTGRITVSFPATHTKVLISPEDKRPSFISSISKVFSAGPRRYEVVKSIWPFANVARGEPGRRCVVMSEEDWFGEWRGAIVHAALRGRKKVWVTAEDQLEVLMAPQRGIADREQGTLEWGGGLLDDERYRY